MTDIAIDTIRLAQRGDEDASRTIIETLQRPVLGTIYRFLGPRYRGELEDIAQEVFLKLFRSIDKFEPERGVKFTTWVYTFVRNHCFDVAKRRRLPTLSLTGGRDDESPIDPADASSRPPASLAENTELGQQITDAIATLGDDQRMVFVLREYEGLDYAEIAEVMGTSEGTVKSRLHRAREALRHRLAPYVRAMDGDLWIDDTVDPPSPRDGKPRDGHTQSGEAQA